MSVFPETGSLFNADGIFNEMERVFRIVLRSVGSGGICSGRASGVSPEMYVDGTESIPRCSRAPRKLSSPPEWSLVTCTSTMFLLMVGIKREKIQAPECIRLIDKTRQVDGWNETRGDQARWLGAGRP